MELARHTLQRDFLPQTHEAIGVSYVDDHRQIYVSPCDYFLWFLPKVLREAQRVGRQVS